MVENSILLSIHPIHSISILVGQKTFEFRRKIWNDDKIEKVYLYSSSPIKRITGYFTIKRIFSGTPQDLWDFCKKGAGIMEHIFFRYFENAEIGYAIEIDNYLKFKDPFWPVDIDPNFKAPQNFTYLKSLNEDLQAAIIKNSWIERTQSFISRLEKMLQKQKVGWLSNEKREI